MIKLYLLEEGITTNFHAFLTVQMTINQIQLNFF